MRPSLEHHLATVPSAFRVESTLDGLERSFEIASLAALGVLFRLGLAGAGLMRRSE